eukprot:gene8292-116_t
MGEKSSSDSSLIKDYYWYSVVIGGVVITASILLAVPATIMIGLIGFDIAAHESVWYFGFVNLLSFVLLLLSALVGCISGGLYKFPRIRLIFAILFPIVLVSALVCILITLSLIGSIQNVELFGSVQTRLIFSLSIGGFFVFCGGLVVLSSFIQIAYTINEIIKEIKDPHSNNGELEKQIFGKIGNTAVDAAKTVHELHDDSDEEHHHQQSGFVVNNNF